MTRVEFYRGHAVYRGGVPDEPVTHPQCAACLTDDERHPYYLDGGRLTCLRCMPGVAAGDGDLTSLSAWTPDGCREWVESLRDAETLSPAQTLAVLMSYVGVHREALHFIPDVVEAFTNREKAPELHGDAVGSWVGEEGKRCELKGLTCTEVKQIGSHDEYGLRFLIRFLARDGSQVVWFTGEGGKFDPKPNGVYDIKATVKQHGSYAGVKQTIIQRPKEL